MKELKKLPFDIGKIDFSKGTGGIEDKKFEGSLAQTIIRTYCKNVDFTDANMLGACLGMHCDVWEGITLGENNLLAFLYLLCATNPKTRREKGIINMVKRILRYYDADKMVLKEYWNFREGHNLGVNDAVFKEEEISKDKQKIDSKI